jgi:hypothetical protein
LRRAELNNGFIAPVIAAVSGPEPYHLFWDDVDKLKLTNFKTEVLFDLVDTLDRQKHGLTVTGNYSMHDLVERERMHPVIVRRLDDMCRVVEV